MPGYLHVVPPGQDAFGAIQIQRAAEDRPVKRRNRRERTLAVWYALLLSAMLAVPAPFISHLAVLAPVISALSGVLGVRRAPMPALRHALSELGVLYTSTQGSAALNPGLRSFTPPA